MKCREVVMVEEAEEKAVVVVVATIVAEKERKHGVRESRWESGVQLLERKILKCGACFFE